MIRQGFSVHLSQILAVMADALESNEPPQLQGLVDAAPMHGWQRFAQEYGVAELFAENRILRRVIAGRVEEGLERRFERDEAAALHSMIDLIQQGVVLALVQRQKKQLHRAAEAELKYLSFLSHDLGNNLAAIRANLEVVRLRVSQRADMRDSAEALGSALDLMTDTIQGMRSLLMHERLRTGQSDRPLIEPVNLLAAVSSVARVFEREAQSGGCHVQVEIDASATASTDRSLLSIIVQNLVGNAVKHACRSDGGGVVRIEVERRPPLMKKGEIGSKENVGGTKGLWKLSIADNGPGIAEEALKHLFEPFNLNRVVPLAGRHETGARIGEEMWAAAGLGLSIAGQAATMLGTRIEVETVRAEQAEAHGRSGSTFSLLLPAA